MRRLLQSSSIHTVMIASSPFAQEGLVGESSRFFASCWRSSNRRRRPCPLSGSFQRLLDAFPVEASWSTNLSSSAAITARLSVGDMRSRRAPSHAAVPPSVLLPRLVQTLALEMVLTLGSSISTTAPSRNTSPASSTMPAGLRRGPPAAASAARRPSCRGQAARTAVVSGRIPRQTKKVSPACFDQHAEAVADAGNPPARASAMKAVSRP